MAPPGLACPNAKAASTSPLASIPPSVQNECHLPPFAKIPPVRFQSNTNTLHFCHCFIFLINFFFLIYVSLCFIGSYPSLLTFPLLPNRALQRGLEYSRFLLSVF